MCPACSQQADRLEEILVQGNQPACDGVCACREAIAARPAAPKLLLLNGSHDRETGTSPSGGNSGMTVSEVVQAVCPPLPCCC